MRPNADYAGNPAFAQSFDARDWAKAFCEMFWITRNTNDPDVSTELDDQEGLMIGWFANAIMRGWDEHARRYPPSPNEQF